MNDNGSWKHLQATSDWPIGQRRPGAPERKDTFQIVQVELPIINTVALGKNEVCSSCIIEFCLALLSRPIRASTCTRPHLLRDALSMTAFYKHNFFHSSSYQRVVMPYNG